MYIQIENARIIVSEPVPNAKTPEKNPHWFFVRQPMLMYKNGETYPDKFNLSLTVESSKANADKVEPFPAGYYVLDEEAFHQVASAANREPEMSCNFRKIRLMNEKELEFFGLSDKSKADPLAKKFGA